MPSTTLPVPRGHAQGVDVQVQQLLIQYVASLLVWSGAFQATAGPAGSWAERSEQGLDGSERSDPSRLLQVRATRWVRC
jgi:hypothetical protein